MAEWDDLPDDENEDGYEEAYETHRSGLYDMIVAYADEHELGDGFLADIVADLGLSLRMVAYAAETEKPSIGGLRLDLDRFVRELGDSVREAKKQAPDFIAEAKAAREEEGAEGDEGDDEADTEAVDDTRQ
ncbi:hypothetical protein FHS55_002014 [Angulomicrobium tetraedrale]|uniref:Uncharacterized protein n=1 Tax=Ancylobacter tetraedralis TaxID=217068 RepID=A0A839Z9E6_9HYPH|nr:hypothetical protein [Ancylobacter tetraedralis]MBB3771415.1 hypothetical protein [Ancylobacter tetraedralis]